MGSCVRCGKKTFFILQYCNECAAIVNEEYKRTREIEKRQIENEKAKAKAEKERLQRVANECNAKVNQLLKDCLCEDINEYDAYRDIVNIIYNTPEYKTYLNSLINNYELQPGEQVVFISVPVEVYESKNTCKMERTGLSYERHPIWNVTETKIAYCEKIIITDRRVFIPTYQGTRNYSFKKFVNTGVYNDRKNKAFFDLKTTSPYPHRFIIKAMYDKDICEFENFTLMLKMFWNPSTSKKGR